MPTLADLPRTWTFEDLQQLPETDDDGNDVDWRRFEILDGALVVSPHPAPRHEITAIRLGAALSRFAPDRFDVAGALGIVFGASYLAPDLVVVSSALYYGDSAIVDPADALLVVEIVSPGSRTMDRVTKPAQYAAAGIPGFWRVETEPEVSLTAYTLRPGADSYSELGSWGPGQTIEVDEPFPVRLAVDALVPAR